MFVTILIQSSHLSFEDNLEITLSDHSNDWQTASFTNSNVRNSLQIIFTASTLTESHWTSS